MSIDEELKAILFLDIETVPAFRTIDEVPEDLREIWKESYASKKSKKAEEEDGSLENNFNYENAGLYAEFGKVICISLGRFEGGIANHNFKVHSIAAHDEKEILGQFKTILNKYINFRLCAHNGKGFDFPFLGKRFLINQLQLPAQLNIQGKKPWEVPHLDTMDLWAFGSKSNGVKLKLLCAALGIPSPKDDIDGSMVRSVYYEENDLPRIVKYCEKDVVALAQVYKKLVGIF